MEGRDGGVAFLSSNKKSMDKKLKRLLALRQECADYGDIANLQRVNYEIAKIAKKLGVDYYSL